MNICNLKQCCFLNDINTRSRCINTKSLMNCGRVSLMIRTALNTSTSWSDVVCCSSQWLTSTRPLSLAPSLDHDVNIINVQQSHISNAWNRVFPKSVMKIYWFCQKGAKKKKKTVWSYNELLESYLSYVQNSSDDQNSS